MVSLWVMVRVNGREDRGAVVVALVICCLCSVSYTPVCSVSYVSVVFMSISLSFLGLVSCVVWGRCRCRCRVLMLFGGDESQTLVQHRKFGLREYVSASVHDVLSCLR